MIIKRPSKEKLKEKLISAESKFLDNFRGLRKDNYLTYTD